MARGEKLKQSQVMVDAADRGMRGRQQAHDSLMQADQQGRRDATNAAVQIGGLAEQGEARQLSEREAEKNRQAQGGQREFQSAEAEAERKWRSSENEKQRAVTESMAEEDRKVRSDIAQDDFTLKSRGQDIDAADRGIEGTSQVESERAKRTREEMDRGAQQTGAAPPGGQGKVGPISQEDGQRLGDQIGKPMEYTGSGYQSQNPQGGPRKSGARLEREGREARLQQQQIELNNQKLYMNAFDYKKKAAEPPSEKRDLYLADNLKAMSSSIEKTREMLGDVVNDEIDFNDVAAAYADNPQIKAATDSGTMTKARVVEFVRAQVGTQQLTYMAASGHMPPGYDPTNPVIRKFNERMVEVAAVFRGSQPMDTSQGDAFDQAWEGRKSEVKSQAVQWMGIKTPEERDQFLRKLTANVMMEADAYRGQQTAALKASGWVEKFQGLQAERDEALQRADMEAARADRAEQQLGLLGSPQTEMRQGMDAEGNPATPPTKVKTADSRDRNRVQGMQDDNERDARADRNRDFVNRGGYQ